VHDLLARATALLGQQQRVIEDLIAEYARVRAELAIVRALTDRLLVVTHPGAPTAIPPRLDHAYATLVPIVPIPCRICATPFLPGASCKTICKACRSQQNKRNHGFAPRPTHDHPLPQRP
jgi:hypothetical protein